MKIETLKELIEIEFRRCETISQFKSEVFRLLDVYDNDREKSNLQTEPIKNVLDTMILDYNRTSK
jgi:hypothetical protein